MNRRRSKRSSAKSSLETPVKRVKVPSTEDQNSVKVPTENSEKFVKTPTKSSEKFVFGIDRGGTFTDVWSRTPSGRVQVLKLLSEDPQNYEDAPTEAIRRIIQQVLLMN